MYYKTVRQCKLIVVLKRLTVINIRLVNSGPRTSCEQMANSGPIVFLLNIKGDCKSIKF